MIKDNIHIRKQTKNDCNEVRRLIQELADYEKMPNGPKINAKNLEIDGFGDEIYYHCLVAEDKELPDKLIGYVLFYYTYSTWQGKALYMEDLYVTPSYRRQGIGKEMWKEALKIGMANNICRCDFSVLNWNKPSIEFYKSCGAFNNTDKEGWNSFRMIKDDIIKFINN